jgi:tetratricopeptide (TPR) repeat protein
MAHARLAEVWAELDYSDKANYELSLLVNLVPLLERRFSLSDVDGLYVAVVKTTINGNFRNATDLYKQIVQKDPGNAIAWMDLGRSYERVRRWDDDGYSYQQASFANPSLASAFLRLGIVAIARNDEQKANTAFDRAFELYKTANDNEGMWDLLNRRAVLALRSGREDDARKFQDEANQMEYFDEYEYVKNRFALANVSHKDSKLAKWFESEARRRADFISRVGLLFHGPDPLLVDGLLDIAALYTHDNDLINAQAYVLEALSIARRSDLRIGKAKAFYADAQLYLHEGFPENADRELRECLRLELPNEDFSDKEIALWRNTVLDVDYDVAIDRFRNEHLEAGTAFIIRS